MKNSLLAAVLMVLLVACCPCITEAVFHDAQNPCTPDQPSFDPESCEDWQRRFPKEYALYTERMEMYKAHTAKKAKQYNLNP